MEHSEPSVGVVIRTRDRPVFLARALASVRAQTHGTWQVALVNDGGAPGPVDALLAPAGGAPAVPPERLHLLHLDPGVGRAAAFNRGVAALQTDFITCLDDDDTWEPGFMAALVAFHAQIAPLVPDLGGVAALARAVIEEFLPDPADPLHGTLRELGEEPLPRAFQRSEFFLNPLAYACYRQDLYPVQWMLRREAVLRTGGFPEAFDVMEDRAFMNRFLRDHRLAILDKPLARHHRRAARRSDTARTVAMNTLDNPSYDWRMYADLALPPDGLDPAFELLREVNYETSAIWQKIDGEASDLRQRLAALEAGMAKAAPGRPAPAPPAAPAKRPKAALFDLWHRASDPWQAGVIAPDTPFADRFVLSQGFSQPGTMFALSVPDQRFEVQIPETRDWAAVEFLLDGLIPPGAGLRWELSLHGDTGFLFETALCQRLAEADGQVRHQFHEPWVHACRPGAGCRVTRHFDSGALAVGQAPRLSVILPRQARNFRFCCAGFVLEAG